MRAMAEKTDPSTQLITAKEKLLLHYTYSTTSDGFISKPTLTFLSPKIHTSVFTTYVSHSQFKPLIYQLTQPLSTF